MTNGDRTLLYGVGPPWSTSSSARWRTGSSPDPSPQWGRVAAMLKTIFRPLAIAIVCLVNVVTLTLGPRVPPQFWSVVALCIVAEVILLGGALAFVDRMTARKAPEPDADEDAGSPYRSQVQSGSGNVQAGGDISNVDADGDVSIRLNDYLVETDSLRGVGLRANGGELALTHNGQRFVIRYDPRS